MPNELLKRLLENVSDQRELELIISSAAGGYAKQTGQNCIQYYTPNPNPSVFATTKFRQGKMIEIIPGPALQSETSQNELVQLALNEASHIHGFKTVDRVLLAERKFVGCWQWKDKLRIQELPTSAPISGGLDWSSNAFKGTATPFDEDGSPYPLVLRIRVPISPNPLVEGARFLSELDKFQNLLTLLLTGHIKGFDASSSRSWVLIDRGSGIENHLLHRGFNLGEMSEWSGEKIDDRKTAPIYQGDDYYNHLWVQEKEISISPDLAKDLDTFANFSESDTANFLRAAYWYSVGIRNRHDSALATVAFSTAIECLLGKPKRQRCSVCSSEIGAGPTQLFKNHIVKYGTLPESLHAQRSKIYSARSALVHGRYAPVDNYTFSQADDSMVHDLLVQLVAQRSLINWLRDTNRATRCETEHG